MRAAAAIPHRFTLRVEANGALLYDRAAHQYFQVSAAEAFLLSASQEGPLEAAVQRLTEAMGEDEAREARDGLLERGELGEDGRFPGRVLRTPDVPGAYGAPLVAHLGLTLACNYACAHCYSSSGKRAPGELTLPEVKALVGRLAEAGCMKLVLGIDPTGRVSPCLNLPASFAQGDARKDSIEKLWRAGKGFVAVRAQVPNAQCASCRHYETCRGGCRVRALHVGNGLGGPDSWCHYEPREAPKARRPRGRGRTSNKEKRA